MKSRDYIKITFTRSTVILIKNVYLELRARRTHLIKMEIFEDVLNKNRLYYDNIFVRGTKKKINSKCKLFYNLNSSSSYTY